MEIEEGQYGRIVIISKKGTDSNAAFPLQNEICMIGRHGDCDIRIQNPTVSRMHAKIIADKDGKVWISALSKTQPTLVNNKLVADSEAVLLNSKDIITIANRQLRYEPPSNAPKKTPLRDVTFSYENTATINCTDTTATFLGYSYDNEPTSSLNTQEIIKIFRESETLPKVTPAATTISATSTAVTLPQSSQALVPPATAPVSRKNDDSEDAETLVLSSNSKLNQLYRATPLREMQRRRESGTPTTHIKKVLKFDNDDFAQDIADSENLDPTRLDMQSQQHRPLKRGISVGNANGRVSIPASTPHKGILNGMTSPRKARTSMSLVASKSPTRLASPSFSSSRASSSSLSLSSSSSSASSRASLLQRRKSVSFAPGPELVLECTFSPSQRSMQISEIIANSVQSIGTNKTIFQQQPAFDEEVTQVWINFQPPQPQELDPPVPSQPQSVTLDQVIQPKSPQEDKYQTELNRETVLEQQVTQPQPAQEAQPSTEEQQHEAQPQAPQEELVSKASQETVESAPQHQDEQVPSEQPTQEKESVVHIQESQSLLQQEEQPHHQPTEPMENSPREGPALPSEDVSRHDSPLPQQKSPQPEQQPESSAEIPLPVVVQDAATDARPEPSSEEQQSVPTPMEEVEKSCEETEPQPPPRRSRRRTPNETTSTVASTRSTRSTTAAAPRRATPAAPRRTTKTSSRTTRSRAESVEEPKPVAEETPVAVALKEIAMIRCTESKTAAPADSAAAVVPENPSASGGNGVAMSREMIEAEIFLSTKDLKVVDLKKRLKELNLSTGGLKADLVKRLIEALLQHRTSELVPESARHAQAAPAPVAAPVAAPTRRTRSRK